MFAANKYTYIIPAVCYFMSAIHTPVMAIRGKGNSERPLFKPETHPLLVHGRQALHYLTFLAGLCSIHNNTFRSLLESLKHAQEFEPRVLRGVGVGSFPAGFQLVNPLVEADDLQILLGEMLLDYGYE